MQARESVLVGVEPLEPESNDDTDKTAQATRTEALVQNLGALRKLAAQLNSHATTADEQMLRAIINKREVLLNNIKSLLAVEPVDGEPAEPVSFSEQLETAGPEERDAITKTVAEIAAMDREAERFLKDRAEKVANEIQKIRAGRKWRESSR